MHRRNPPFRGLSHQRQPATRWRSELQLRRQGPERVFFDLNVGDDPTCEAKPKEAVLHYRERGHRSLSVGDVVEMLDGRYAVDRCGFRQI